MPKTYLVTGGTGFLGAAIVRRLAASGNTVKSLDNDIRGTPQRLGDTASEVELIKADVRDAKAVSDACRDVDCVVHMAFINGTEFFYSQPKLVLDVGVKGMVNVLDACVEHGIGELVVASSSEVYQNPPNVPTDESAPLLIPDPLNPRYSYAGGKIISELMALNWGRKDIGRVVVFRPHNVYGPDMGWEHVIPQFALRMKKICEKDDSETVEFPIQGTGSETRAFVYVDDFTDGLELLIEQGEHMGIYHVGTMDEKRISDVAKEVGAFWGRNVNVVAGKLMEGGTPRRCPDISKLRKLGYEPKVSLSEGIRKTVEWYDSNSDKRPEGMGARSGR